MERKSHSKKVKGTEEEINDLYRRIEKEKEQALTGLIVDKSLRLL